MVFLSFVRCFREWATHNRLHIFTTALLLKAEPERCKVNGTFRFKAPNKKFNAVNLSKYFE